ncbi:MAG: hypothetical protein KDB35_09120 [Acidimicrobiales bacterium]|nr:hypothetical protein [Acidimicrobiales bacterium]MCB1016993.1 hypothetical protein [Acidimicrobiales bacterium]
MDLRMDLLERLYDAASGDRFALVNWQQFEENLGASAVEVEHAADWLIQRGYAEARVLGPMFSITVDGIDEVERRRAERRRDVDLAAVVLTHDERREVEAVIRPVQEALDSGELQLSGDDEADVRLQLETVQLQLRSNRPRRPIVGWALSAITGIVTGVAGNAAYAGLVALAHALTH